MVEIGSGAKRDIGETKSENPKDSLKLSLKDVLFGWIKNIEHYAKPSKEIAALNFGLFESDKGIYDLSNWIRKI